MIHQSKTIKITENFYCLGPPRAPLFLLNGDSPVIFEGGIYAFREHYLQEARRVLKNRHVCYLLLTHMHFDHCGAAGHLKNHLPGLEVCASLEGAEIIKKKSAVDLISRLNNFFDKDSMKFEPFTVDRVLHDGEILSVSNNMSVEVLKTPGHTRDMLSYYIPEIKTMVPSETAGAMLTDGYIYSEFLVDYDAYMGSLRRLSEYDVDYLMLAHGIYLSGEDARNYFPRAEEAAVRFRKKIQNLIKKYGDNFDYIAGEIRKEEFDNFPEDERQPEEAYILNLRAKVNAVSRTINS